MRCRPQPEALTSARPGVRRLPYLYKPPEITDALPVLLEDGDAEGFSKPGW